MEAFEALTLRYVADLEVYGLHELLADVADAEPWTDSGSDAGGSDDYSLNEETNGLALLARHERRAMMTIPGVVCGQSVTVSMGDGLQTACTRFTGIRLQS